MLAGVVFLGYVSATSLTLVISKYYLNVLVCNRGGVCAGAVAELGVCLC